VGWWHGTKTSFFFFFFRLFSPPEFIHSISLPFPSLLPKQKPTNSQRLLPATRGATFSASPRRAGDMGACSSGPRTWQSSTDG
jgi:hypothetical protein